ncbi:hypothetical protein V8F33_008501 [Rhypophila sp. PSN 637]
MEKIPDEILIAISSELPGVADVGSFRLVCRRWACVGYAVLAQHLSVVKAPGCLDELQNFIAENPASAVYTQHLSIYHGFWSPQSRIDWQLHPLFFGKDIMAVQSRLDQASEEAFHSYEEFMKVERQTTREDYRVKIHGLLHKLPNLRRLTIGHLSKYGFRRPRNAQYARLIRKIWLLPRLENDIEEAVRIVLPALNSLPTVTQLDLLGTFTLHQTAQQCRYITRLRIHPFFVLDSQAEAAIQSLSLFPRLQSLSISLAPARVACLPLGRLSLPEMTRLEIESAVFRYEAFIALIDQHPHLAALELHNVYLRTGSWDQIRQHLRKCRPYITVKGQVVDFLRV